MTAPPRRDGRHRGAGTSIGCVSPSASTPAALSSPGSSGMRRRRRELRRPGAGSVSTKFEPRPGSDHTASSPPCSRASPRAIDSPSPVPPIVRVRDGSARQKRSNTRSTSCGVIPRPKSRTPSATACWLLSTVTTIGRPSPCSMALPSRLRTTRRTRRGSISTGEYPPGATRRTSVPCWSASCCIEAIDVLGEVGEARRLQLELHRARRRSG